MTRSIAISPFTLPAALSAGDPFIGIGGNRAIWTGDPNNREQVAFLETYRRRADIADKMTEIEKNATQDVSQHISWLKSHDWEAQITDGPPGAVFMAAVLRIGGFWEEEGEARVENGIHRALLPLTRMFGSSEKHQAVAIPTKVGGLSFLVQQFDAAPDKQQLIEISGAMVARRKEGLREVAKLDYPMVDLSLKSDADHMIGLRSGGWTVIDAKEQFILQMNHKGGLARAAAEVSSLESFIEEPETVTINGPFVVTLFKDDLDTTPFAAFCDRDSWGSPKLAL